MSERAKLILLLASFGTFFLVVFALQIAGAHPETIMTVVVIAVVGFWASAFIAVHDLIKRRRRRNGAPDK